MKKFAGEIWETLPKEAPSASNQRTVKTKLDIKPLKLPSGRSLTWTEPLSNGASVISTKGNCA
jgi:hypothetical protein